MHVFQTQEYMHYAAMVITKFTSTVHETTIFDHDVNTLTFYKYSKQEFCK